MKNKLSSMILCIFSFVVLLAGCTFQAGGNIDIFEIFEEDDIENYEQVFEDTDLNVMASTESHSLRNGDGSYEFTIDGEEYEFKVRDYYIVRVYDGDREKIWVMEEEDANQNQGIDDADDGDEQTGDEQTGDEQTGVEQTGVEQTGVEQTGDEQIGAGQSGDGDNDNGLSRNEEIVGTISAEQINSMLDDLHALFTTGIRMDCHNISGMNGVIMISGDNLYSQIEGVVTFYIYDGYCYMEDNGQWYYTEATEEFSADSIRSGLGFETIINRFSRTTGEWNVSLLTLENVQYKCVQNGGGALLIDEEENRIVGITSADEKQFMLFTPIDGIELSEECNDAIYDEGAL